MRLWLLLLAACVDERDPYQCPVLNEGEVFECEVYQSTTVFARILDCGPIGEPGVPATKLRANFPEHQVQCLPANLRCILE